MTTPLISIATPNLDHLTKLDYEVVYDPAGQSLSLHLLLQSLELNPSSFSFLEQRTASFF